MTTACLYKQYFYNHSLSYRFIAFCVFFAQPTPFLSVLIGPTVQWFVDELSIERLRGPIYGPVSTALKRVLLGNGNKVKLNHLS